MNSSESPRSQKLADDANPYRAPSVVERAPASADFRKRPMWFRIAIGLQLISTIVGAAVALLTIESIMVSGAVLSIVGIVVAMMSLRHQWGNLPGWTAVFGASGPVVSASCFLLINIFAWSPREATGPIGVLAMLYTVSIVPLGLWVLYRGESGDRGDAGQPVETGQNSVNEPWG